VAEQDSSAEWSLVTFKANGVRFYFGHEADPKERRKSRLFYDVKLDARNPIRLTEGLPIEDTRLGIAVDQISNGDESARPEIGALGYSAALEDGAFKFPQTISADIGVPETVFNELLLAARQGRCPAEIVLAIDGLKESSGFPATEFGWDNSENGKRILPVRGVTFRMHFVEPLEGEGEPVSLDVVPPTPGQFQAAKQSDAIARRIGSITILLALLLVLIFGMLLWQVFWN